MNSCNAGELPASSLCTGKAEGRALHAFFDSECVCLPFRGKARDVDLYRGHGGGPLLVQAGCE